MKVLSIFLKLMVSSVIVISCESLSNVKSEKNKEQKTNTEYYSSQNESLSIEGKKKSTTQLQLSGTFNVNLLYTGYIVSNVTDKDRQKLKVWKRRRRCFNWCRWRRVNAQIRTDDHNKNR